MHPPERRQHRRSALAVQTHVYVDDRLCLRARTLDVSPGGVLVHGAARLDVGQAVRLELARGGQRNPLVLRAEVVRLETPSPGARRHGIALRFVDCGVAERAALSSLLSER